MALCVFKDANPEAPASGRYKAVGRVAKVAGERDGLRAFRSKDGLRWTVLEKDPVLVAPEDGTRPILDSHTVAYWDTNIGQYVAYMRGWVNPRTRAIRRNVSDDFRTWTDPEFIDLGDSPPEHLYKNSCTQYFRAPHIYLMFPKRFVPDRKFHADWEDNGISEAVFMTSRDGVRWDRRFMEGFLRPGLDAGQLDRPEHVHRRRGRTHRPWGNVGLLRRAFQAPNRAHPSRYVTHRRVSIGGGGVLRGRACHEAVNVHGRRDASELLDVSRW